MGDITIDISGVSKEAAASFTGHLHLAVNKPGMLRLGASPSKSSEFGEKQSVINDLENQIELGATVTLSSTQFGDFFEGYVASVDVQRSSGSGTDNVKDRVTLTCFDSVLHKRLIGTSSRVFGSKETSASQILTDIFGSDKIEFLHSAKEVLDGMTFGGENPQWLRENISDLDVLRQFCYDGGLNFWSGYKRSGEKFTGSSKIFVDGFRDIKKGRHCSTFSSTDTGAWKSFRASMSLKGGQEGLISDAIVRSGTVKAKASDNNAGLESEKGTVNDRKFAKQIVTDALGETVKKLVHRSGLSIDHAKKIAEGEYHRRALGLVEAQLSLVGSSEEDNSPLLNLPGDVLEIDVDNDAGVTSKFDGAYFVMGLDLGINLNEITEATVSLSRPFVMEVSKK